MYRKLKNTLDNNWTIYILLFFSFLQRLQRGFGPKIGKNDQKKEACEQLVTAISRQKMPRSGRMVVSNQ